MIDTARCENDEFCIKKRNIAYQKQGMLYQKRGILYSNDEFCSTRLGSETDALRTRLQHLESAPKDRRLVVPAASL